MATFTTDNFGTESMTARRCLLLAMARSMKVSLRTMSTTDSFKTENIMARDALPIMTADVRKGFGWTGNLSRRPEDLQQTNAFHTFCGKPCGDRLLNSHNFCLCNTSSRLHS